MKRSLVSVFLFAALTITANAQTRGAGNACDRECLRGFTTQYLDAMVAHNPKALPLANVKFTENTKTMQLGEGLWKGASRIRTYRQDFLDVRQGVAAAFVVVEENAMP